MTTLASRFQVMRPLTDEEYADLKADVEQNGIAKPIDVDEDGNILDGHHRVRIAGELGISYDTRTIDGLGEDGKRDYARRVNSLGRQLSVDERRTEVAKLRSQGKTQQEIADQLGIGQGTVSKDLSALSKSKDIPSNTGAESDNSDSPSPEPPKSTKHECGDCGLVMREPAWHCHGCGSHYPMGTAICGDCNPPKSETSADEPQSPPKPTTTPKPRARRTDVVKTINQAITKAEDAAEKAAQVKREHLANRSEEATVWSRRLSEALTELERLNTSLQEAST